MSKNVGREIRLALVMNGGISLAVWMGGVTNEIDALRRAGFGLTKDPTDPDGTYELWKRLIGALDANVIVDIVAGASAGGINGAVLATAIARGQPLPSLRDTWIKTADFDTELIDKDAKSDRHSILNGNFFLRSLRETFGHGVMGPSKPRAAGTEADIEPEGDLEMRRRDLEQALARERESPRTVSLVMTGTSLRGDKVGYADEIGQGFGYSDSRVQFHFRRDLRGTRDDFADEPPDREDDDPAPNASGRLARAARATASFPGAFEPIFINVGSDASPVDEAIGDVPEGPDMTGVTSLDSSRYVIDGGVLDNEPFSPVLDELVRRPVDTHVQRVLAYVVPSLGSTGELPPPDSIGTEPGIIETALAATNLPRDLGILGDLEEMQRLQYSAVANRTMRARLLKGALNDTDGSIANSAAAVYRLYRTRRIDGVIWDSRARAAVGDGRDAAALRPLPGVTAPLDLPEGRAWLPPAAGKSHPFSAIVNPEPAEWCWGLSVAYRFVVVLLGSVRDALETPQNEGERTAMSAAALALSTCLERLHELEASRSETVATLIGAHGAFELPDADVLARVDVAFDGAAAPHETRAAVADIVQFAAKAAVRVPSAFGSPSAIAEGSPEEERARKLVRAFLVAEILEGVARDATAPPEAPRFTFHRFGLNPPTWYFNGGATVPHTKLAGSRFGHFGAFFKKAWRWYDWIWGRLDGASQLVDILLDRDLLPLGPGEEQVTAFAALRENLVGLTDERAGPALEQVRAGSDEALERLRGLVVRNLHRAILVEELPKLVAAYEDDGVLRSLAGLDQNATDDELRAALELLHGRFTSTSFADLTRNEDGHDGEWLTVASALRALKVDPRTPPIFRTPLGFAEGWARGRIEDGFRGGARRMVEKTAGVVARGVGPATGVVRAGGAVLHAPARVFDWGRRKL